MVENPMSDAYLEFLRRKIPRAELTGFEPLSTPHESLKPHQIDLAMWMARGGRRACFASFGLGKTRIDLQVAKWVVEFTGGKFLIVAPLGVRQEFTREDGPAMGLELEYVRTDAEVASAKAQILITNYERVRDGDITLGQFAGAALDEASVLRSFGSKTYQEFLRKFKAVPYRYVFTATPSPNRYKELIHYAGFLGVMDTGEALTRFFQRDSSQAGNLTLYPHMEEQFWLWVASWGAFLQKPSDLGHDDTGYDLPKMHVHWHRVDVDHRAAWQQTDSWGQSQLFIDQSQGLSLAAKAKRESIAMRVDFARELIAHEPMGKHWILWHDLEDERREIERQMPLFKTVYGSQELEEREDLIVGFSRGEYKHLATKPSIAGSGCNFQKHCADAIFLGVGYKFNDFIQACHRIFRFQQTREVHIHIIYLDSESTIMESLKEKWRNHNALMERMTAILQRYRLNNLTTMELTKTLGCERHVTQGIHFKALHNDCVLELQSHTGENSVDFICTSIPFGNQYEYSPSFNDFGHNTGDDAFFEQMGFLVPELHRVLKPGRIAAIHVKDRIMFGNVTGHASPTVNPFSDKTTAAFMRHGFVLMARITIDTDVVRENAQTYRLGWSENAKDSTKMGAGMPEYVLIFRKLPSDLANAYADEPVTKSKADYTRADWQLDAAGLWRSNGDRLPDPDILRVMPMEDIKRLWIRHCLKGGYSHEEHVAVAKALEGKGKLPSSFMLFPAVSRNADIWTDICRMLTLNSEQSRRNQEKHVCLARGSLVLTFDGYKPIEEVKIGDLVLTHEGRWKPVLVASCTDVRTVVRVEAQGVPGLTLTPEHKLWTRKVRETSWAIAHSRKDAKNTAPTWVRADETVGRYINLKLPPLIKSTLSLTECWLIGRWLADGHVGTRGDFHVSIGPDKLATFLEKAGKHAGAQAKRTAIQIRLKNLRPIVSNALKRCGRGAAGKSVPGDLLSLPAPQASAMLDGYLSGDGHFLPARNRWTASSVSRALLLGVAILAQRAHGAIASVYAGRPSGEAVIDGRKVSTRQDWVLSFDIPNQSRPKGLPFILADGAWKKVRSAADVGETETWCLRVADDESFTAEGCIVKNCPLQLDVIRRLITRYTNPGDVVMDPFAGIFSVVYQAIKMGRKGMGIELNHEYYRCGSDYCLLAENEVTVPTLFDMGEMMAEQNAVTA